MLAVFVTYPAEKAVYLDANGAYIPASPVFNGNAIISDNSANAALRITQTGAGDALLVEDSANPDATPFVVDASGNVGIGTTTPAAQLELVNTTANAAMVVRATDVTLRSLVLAAASDYFTSFKTSALSQHNASATGTTLGLSNASLGSLVFQNGSNAAIYTNGTNILKIGTNSATAIQIASNQVLSLGSSAGSESLRVTPVASAVNFLDATGAVTTGAPVLSAAGSDTNIGITLTPKGTGKVITSSDMTVNTLTVGLGPNNIASNTAFGYRALVDAATSATSNVAVGYQAGQAITGGSFPSGFANTAVGYGVMANGAGLTGYYNTGVGYQSLLVVTTGYGNTAIGQGSGLGISTGNNNSILGSYTASASPISATGSNFVVLSDGAGTVRQTHNSSGAVAFDTAGTVFGTSGEVLTSGGSGAVPTWTTVGTMSTQNANAVAITGGAIDGTTVGSTTAAAGSFTTLAASGVTVIGTSTGAVNGSLQLRRNITGGTTAYVAGVSATVQSDVTGQASGYNTFINTVASSFTLGILKHYNAQQGTIGATSAVTNQYGFFADSSLVGATNNYGFYSDIASGTNRFNFAAVGTAANVFVGTTSLGGLVGAESLRATPVASSVNYLEAKGAATGVSPTITAAGSDTNISLTLTAKGTGKVISTTDATINGITVGKGGGSLSNNTAVGSGALALNTTGNQNTGVGFNALYFTNTGIFNTAVGTSALTCNTVASSQTAVGYQALINATTAVATFGAITAGSGYTNGTYTAVAMTPVSGATFITYPTVTVVVAGGVVTTVTLVTAGIIASSTAATVLTVAAALIGGTGSGFSIAVSTFVTGASNTAIGYQTLVANTAGSSNTALGYQAGSTLVSGGNNLILGNTAAASTTTVSNEITLGNSSITAFRIPGLTITAGASALTIGSQFAVTNTASSVNYLNVTGAVTTGAPVLSAAGSDTNIDLALTPKGTGVLSFGTYTAGIIAQAGYITIKDAGGTTRRLLVG
jgi:hypothetical protein